MTEEELLRSDATIGEFIRRHSEYKHLDGRSKLEDIVGRWARAVDEGNVFDMPDWYASFGAFIKVKKKELGIVDQVQPFDCGTTGVWRDIEEYDERMEDVLFLNGDEWNIYDTPHTTHFFIIPPSK